MSIRGLDTKGVKNVLVQRLQKALDEEKEAEENPKPTEAEENEDEQEAKPNDPETAPEDPMNTSVASDKKDEIPEDPLNESEIITLDQLVEKTEEDEFTQDELYEIKRERDHFVSTFIKVTLKIVRLF